MEPNQHDEREIQVEDMLAAEQDNELTIEELDTVSAGLSISSLACYACPVSSFSSVSN